MRRLKNRTGTSLLLPPRGPPKLNMPWPSRKKSRFSGNCRLKRVRLTCCRSSSTCAKSVFTVASAIRLRVRPYLKSNPAFGETRLEKGVAAARACRARARRREVPVVGVGARHLRQERLLVLPLDDAAEVDAPDLRS